MEIKFIRVYLTGAKRINELFEECARKDGKIREMETERDFHRVQLKGYGKDFQALLEQIEEHKQQEREQARKLELLKSMFIESEKARKSLGEKLCQAERELKRLRDEKDGGTGEDSDKQTGDTSSAPDVRTGAPSPQGEGRATGGDEA